MARQSGMHKGQVIRQEKPCPQCDGKMILSMKMPKRKMVWSCQNDKCCYREDFRK